MLGLNDVHIAHTRPPDVGKGRAGHEKGDGRYVLSRRPDYIMFGSSRGGRFPLFRSDREIYRSRKFRRRYRHESHPLPDGGTLHVYRHRKSQSLHLD